MTIDIKDLKPLIDLDERRYKKPRKTTKEQDLEIARDYLRGMSFGNLMAKYQLRSSAIKTRLIEHGINLLRGPRSRGHRKTSGRSE